MKAKYEIEELEPAFAPVTVSFTFTTQMELNAFGRLFNVGCVIEGLRKEGVKFGEMPLYRVFEQAGADISPIEPLRTNIKAGF